MHRLNITFLTLSTLLMIGCGGGGSTDITKNNTPTANNTHDEENTPTENENTHTDSNTHDEEGTPKNYTYFPSNVQANDKIIFQKMTGALQAQQLFSPLGAKYISKYCFDDKKNPRGSKKVRWAIASPGHNDASVTVTQYDKEDCTGNTTVSTANYTYSLHKLLDDGKSIEINFNFQSGEDITDLVPYHLFGYGQTKNFHTILTASGTVTNNDFRIGLAKPSNTSTNPNTGDTEALRANDLSNFTEQNYFFGQIGTGSI